VLLLGLRFLLGTSSTRFLLEISLRKLLEKKERSTMHYSATSSKIILTLRRFGKDLGVTLTIASSISQ
jgi:hypothetical protein